MKTAQNGKPWDKIEGSTTIPSHRWFRNHLELLLESTNHVEIPESGIITSTIILVNLVILRILRITSSACPYLVNRDHQNQFKNLGIKPRFLTSMKIQSCGSLEQDAFTDI